MHARRYVTASALGSLVAAGIFFVALDRLHNAERWTGILVAAVLFGLFMAAWNGILIRLDSTQRTARNVLFENAVAEFSGVMAAAWALAPLLGHLRWQDLALYTVLAVPLLGLIWFLTRKNIKGEHPSELFP